MSKIFCGSGHRPQFCPCKFDENHKWLLGLKEDLKSYLLTEKPKAVITGGAIGMDTWLAEATLDLEIPLHLYIPFRGQGKNWPKESQKKYEDILNRATVVKYISETYSKYAFLQRDEAMVNDCDVVLALLNPEANSGGTYYTVNYAKNNSKQVINFWR